MVDCCYIQFVETSLESQKYTAMTASQKYIVMTILSLVDMLAGTLKESFVVAIIVCCQLINFYVELINFV